VQKSGDVHRIGSWRSLWNAASIAAFGYRLILGEDLEKLKEGVNSDTFSKASLASSTYSGLSMIVVSNIVVGAGSVAVAKRPDGLTICSCNPVACAQAMTLRASRTTHISGMFTDLCISLGHALRGLPVDRLRLRLCFLIISAFFCGGVAGAFCFHHLGYSTLLIPAALTGLTALMYGVWMARRMPAV